MASRWITFFLLIAVMAQAQIGAKMKDQKIYGVWQNNQMGFQMTLILNENNSGEFDGEAIQFSVSGNVLSVTQAGATTRYNFTLGNNTLTLSGGDLDQPIAFTKGGNQTMTANNGTPSQQSSAKPAAALVGSWSGNGETIQFNADGTCQYLGQTFGYETTSTQLSLVTSQGKLVMNYLLSGNQLTLSANGRQIIYTKGTSAANQSTTAAGAVAQELVGKWCYVDVNNYSNGGSSSSNCITLHPDGTFEYYGESSRRVNTPDFSGGTNSQSSDRGTWWVQGDRIFYNSQSRGQGSYQLQKRNHPKNGDPMIVLDGETYVTFYNKAPWR